MHVPYGAEGRRGGGAEGRRACLEPEREQKRVVVGAADRERPLGRERALPVGDPGEGGGGGLRLQCNSVVFIPRSVCSLGEREIYRERGEREREGARDRDRDRDTDRPIGVVNVEHRERARRGAAGRAGARAAVHRRVAPEARGEVGEVLPHLPWRRGVSGGAIGAIGLRGRGGRGREGRGAWKGGRTDTTDRLAYGSRCKATCVAVGPLEPLA
jgi:hypothetical protein